MTNPKFMKYLTAIRCLVVALLVGVALEGCRTKTQEEEVEEIVIDSLPAAIPGADDLNSDQSALFQAIMGESADGVIRGISFGDPVSKIKSTERFEMFEDTTGRLGYTHDTEQLETIDVLYHHTANRVSRITVDVYLNSPVATRQLWNAARRNFTERYGSPQQETPQRIFWKKFPAQVVIENVSVGKDFGLKMTFDPANKKTIAAKQ
jgi:hypothetical protein